MTSSEEEEYSFSSTEEEDEVIEDLDEIVVFQRIDDILKNSSKFHQILEKITPSDVCFKNNKNDKLVHYTGKFKCENDLIQLVLSVSKEIYVDVKCFTNYFNDASHTFDYLTPKIIYDRILKAIDKMYV